LERRFSKQNSVIRLKSYTLAPQNFWVGYATAVGLLQFRFNAPFVHLGSRGRKFAWLRF